LPGNVSGNGYSSVSALKSSLNDDSIPAELKVKVKVKVKVEVTLGLAAYRKSFLLGVKPLETCSQRFFF
jgi:hypothetical protein